MDQEDIKLKRDGGKDGWMDLAGLHEQLARPVSINYRHRDEYGWMEDGGAVWRCDSRRKMRGDRDEGGRRRRDEEGLQVVRCTLRRPCWRSLISSANS